MKTKTPAGYVAPLRSRTQIVAWLLDRAKSNRRPGYGMFCYDVKLRRLDTSFARALKLGREAGHVAADESPRYLAALEARWDEVMETAFELGTQDACESVMDNDTNRMLWDGDRAIADWEFNGRSGGWLCLKRFEGVELGAFDPADLFAESGYRWLRNLYRFLVQCDHDFRRPESEVEYLAADYFFANRIDDIPTDTAIASEQAAALAESAERAHWEARDTVTV